MRLPFLKYIMSGVNFSFLKLLCLFSYMKVDLRDRPALEKIFSETKYD